MQRSTPSLFRLRTGVRIPPPPAFARVTTSELQLGRRAILELCESCRAVAAVGRVGGPPGAVQSSLRRVSPSQRRRKWVQYLGLLVQISRGSCLRTCVSKITYRVYVLESLTDPERHYTGHTSDEVAVRLSWHNQGRSRHTAKYRPWKVIVSMEFCEERVAVAFERYLKSGSGRAFAKRHFSDHSRPPFPDETADTLIGP